MSSEEETQLLSDAELHSAPSGRAHCTLRGCSAKKEHRDIRQHYRQSHSMYAPVQFPEEGTQHVFRSKHGYFRCPRCESIYYSTATLQKHTRTCDAPPPQVEQMLPQPVSVVPIETLASTDVPVQQPTPERLDSLPHAQLPQVEQGPSQPASVVSVEPSPPADVSMQRPTPERSDTFPPAQPPTHTQPSPVPKQDVPKELSKHDFPNQLRHILHQTSSSHSRAEHRFKPYPSSNTPGGERQKSRSNNSVPYPLAFHPSSLVRHHTPVSLQHQHLQHHEPSLPFKRPDPNPIKSENTTYHPPEFRLPPYMTPSPFNQPIHSESSSDKDKEKPPTPIISDPKLTEDPMEGMQLMYPSSDEELEETQSPRVPSPEPARIPTRGYKPSLSPVSPVSPLTPVSPVSPFMPKMPVMSGNVPTQGPLTPPPERTTFVPYNRRRPPPPIMSNLRHQLPSPVPSPLNSMHPGPPGPPIHTTHPMHPVHSIPTPSSSASPMPTMPRWCTRYLQLTPEFHQLFERPLIRFGITSTTDIDILCTWHPDLQWRVLRNWLSQQYQGQIGTIQWMCLRQAMLTRRNQLAGSGSMTNPNPFIRPQRQPGVSSLQVFEQMLRRPLGDQMMKILAECDIRSGQQLDMICVTCEDWDMLRREFVAHGMSEFGWLLVQDGFNRWRASSPMANLRASS